MVENQLRKMKIGNPKMNDDGHWANCRLNPWGMNRHVTMLPDGNSDPRLTMDLYAYTDIAYNGNFSFTIATVPAQPYSAYIYFPTAMPTLTLTGSYAAAGPPPGAFFGTSTNGGGYQFSGGTVAGVQLPICFSEWATAYNYTDDPTIVSATSFVNSDKARITSQAWRLVYTGPASACSGVVNVASTPLRLDPIQNKQTGNIQITNPVTGIINNSNTALRPVPIQPWGYQYNSNANKDTITERPEAGMKGRCKRSNQTFGFKEIYNNPVLPVQQNQNTSATIANIGGFFNGGYTGVAVGNSSTMTWGTYQLLDTDWDSTIITCSNVPGSFRFETWTCIEFIPEAQSLLYHFASAPPAADTNLITKVETIVANAPIATSSVGS
jgi:hypothetical protein